MKKRDKYLKKSLETLQIEIPDYIKNSKDVESEIAELKTCKYDLEVAIENAKENLEKVIEIIETYNVILKQIEIEELQELNPKAKVFYL